MAVGIDKYLNDIKTKILGNSSLCKYLFYDSDNPLSELDIVDTSILYTDYSNQKLFFTPFTIDNSDSRKSTLSIVVDNFSLNDKTHYFKDMRIDFIVVIHNNLWILNDGSGEIKLRANAIWNEINKTFSHQRTVGVGLNIFDYCKIFYPNEFFTGYRFCLTATDIPTLGV